MSPRPAPRAHGVTAAETRPPARKRGGGKLPWTWKSLTGFTRILVIYRLGFILFGEIVSVVIIEARAGGRLPTDSPPGQPQCHPPAKHFHPPSGREVVDRTQMN